MHILILSLVHLFASRAVVLDVNVTIDSSTTPYCMDFVNFDSTCQFSLRTAFTFCVTYGQVFGDLECVIDVPSGAQMSLSSTDGITGIIQSGSMFYANMTYIINGNGATFALPTTNTGIQLLPLVYQLFQTMYVSLLII